MLIAALLLSSYHLSPFSTGLGLLALQLHDVRFVCSFSVTANKARQSGISSSSSFASSKDLWKKHSTFTSNLNWPKTYLRFSSVVVIEVLQSGRYALVIGRQKGQILLTDIASLYASTRSMVHVLTLNYTARVHFRTLSSCNASAHLLCVCETSFFIAKYKFRCFPRQTRVAPPISRTAAASALQQAHKVALGTDLYFQPPIPICAWNDNYDMAAFRCNVDIPHRVLSFYFV